MPGVDFTQSPSRRHRLGPWYRRPFRRVRRPRRTTLGYSRGCAWDPVAGERMRSLLASTRHVSRGPSASLDRVPRLRLRVKQGQCDIRAQTRGALVAGGWSVLTGDPATLVAQDGQFAVFCDGATFTSVPRNQRARKTRRCERDVSDDDGAGAPPSPICPVAASSLLIPETDRFLFTFLFFFPHDVIDALEGL